MKKPIRIGALISGTGTNMDAIINACNTGRINGRVIFAGADNPGAKGLKKAEKADIPTFVVDYADIIRRFGASAGQKNREKLPPDFDLEDISRKQSIVSLSETNRLHAFLKTRSIAEAALLKQMALYPFDLLVLAGFMRNLTPYFIDRVNTDPARPKIMNIHPALLPAFPGTDGYGDTFRYGCKVGGCTVHFIDYGEDSGPIIGQRCFPIEDDDTIESIKKKGLETEWALYPECVRMFAEDRLKTVKMTHTRANGEIFHRTVVKVIPSS
ncbi:MAG: phosphoribosylglycinamide formyltransferase [Desulfosalsimonadaceae bacterium]